MSINEERNRSQVESIGAITEQKTKIINTEKHKILLMDTNIGTTSLWDHLFLHEQILRFVETLHQHSI